MADTVTRVPLELSVEDARILRDLAEYLGVTRATLLRWALRSYVVDGPWAVSVAEREEILGGTKTLDLGPRRRGPI